jgi:transposase
MSTGVPWRDLPREFGHWNAVYKRFNYWSNSGILMKSFKELSKDTDTEREFIDGSYMKAHQHSARARGNYNQAIGLSRGGNTSKISVHDKNR